MAAHRRPAGEGSTPRGRPRPGGSSGPNGSSKPGGWRGLVRAARRALLLASAALMGLLLVALVTLDFTRVVLRYYLGEGFAWAPDLAVTWLITLAWLGAGHLWLARSHIAIDLFVQPRWLRAGVDLAVIAGALVLLPLVGRTIDAFGFIDLPALPASAAVKYWPIWGGVAYLGVAALVDLLCLADEATAEPGAPHGRAAGT